jgi:hypothetical protein
LVIYISCCWVNIFLQTTKLCDIFKFFSYHKRTCWTWTGLGPKLCMFITQIWKYMFLVAQIFFHPSIVYAWLVCNIILLWWTKH